MTSNLTSNPAGLTGHDLYDRDGDKVGKIGQVYLDQAGQPAWASVHTGLFGLNESLVPLAGASLHGDGDLRVGYEKSKIKEAPNVDVSHDEPFSADQVEELYRYYDLGWDTPGTEDYASGYTAGAQHTQDSYTQDSYTGGEQDRRGSGDGMTRSEERLNVGTETEQTGRARLRKYVVTENVQTTVPVQREEVRVEREPISASNRDEAYSGPSITESEHEVTLHAERPVVNKETVPVEQVRLGTETVTDHETVGGQVRKEQIEADLPNERGTRNIG